MPKNQKAKKRPKPGDADYMSPTQLRNARKRRKQQRDKQTTKQQQDPSIQYLFHPMKAPIIQQAVNFFDKKFPIILGPTRGWRTVAKLAVRQQQGVITLGLFVPNSHQLVAVSDSPVHHARITTAIATLQTCCRQAQIQAFDEMTGKGNLSYVLIQIERRSGRQQVTLVWKGNDDSSLQTLCEKLQRVSNHKFELHSLWVHYHRAWKHSNNILDYDTGNWELRKPQSKTNSPLVEYLMVPSAPYQVGLHFPPQVFRQANLDAFAGIVERIRQWLLALPETVDTCVELYGGVGTIGLYLVDLIASSFVSSDLNPYNQDCFHAALEKLRQQDRDSKLQFCGQITYISKDATQMVLEEEELLEAAELIVVDPPRKGLDGAVLDFLCKTTTSSRLPKYLIYVSCGFQAFQRDYTRLTETGSWALDHAEGHVLFPGSDAIETLAFFKRKG